ncbi:phage tail tape measure protein [Aeromonas caviae]|uniref:Phage tail tape measure protein n=1 Tax=Aeromonas caviae TaxID=648 RepID=A0AAW9F2U4_AERCA|nr:hypothetical protein [Aeromonas caviae]MDX7721027.1 hypothetical protein [Aeromonas caviae]
MAKQLVTDIVINLAGNLATKSRQYSQSMSQFAANNQRAMNMLKMSTAAAGRGIDNLGNRYVAFGTAMVGGAAVRGYAQLDRRISRIAIAAEISRDKAKELKEEINAVSSSRGIRIDPNEATSAIEEILTKTGDLEYAMANLPNIAAVIQATGAGGLEVGGIFTEFKKLAITNNDMAMRAIDTLNLQGKSGAFTLGNMAKEGPKIFAAYAATGRQGAAAVTELGAALQVIRQGVGSDAEAVTAFESIIRDITRPDTVKKLKQLGNIDVFDQEQLKQGREVMRSLPVLIEEIVTKSGGLSSKLSLLNLTDEAKRALKPVIAEFVQTGDVKAFDEFLKLSGDGSTTLNDAAVAAGDFAASLQLVSNSWSQFANQQLAEPIAELADAINSLEPDAVQKWLETGKNIALVVGGLVAVKKGVDAFRWTKDAWEAAKPGKGKKGGMGDAMADLGATPVYVVNMPGGGMGGGGMGPGDMPGTEPGKGGKGSKPSRFSPAGLVQFGTVAAGLSMVPDFSPINISRANGMSVNGIPQAPGILDVFDEMKAFFTRDISASPRPDNLSGTLDINVRDDRITVRTRDTAPGIQVRVDNGPSLMP